MHRGMKLCLFALLTGCATPQDSSFGTASFTVNGQTTAATAFATPEYVWLQDSHPNEAWKVTLVPASDVPSGSPCNGSYDATIVVQFDIITSQLAAAGNLSEEPAELSRGAMPVVWNDDGNGSKTLAVLDAPTVTIDSIQKDSSSLTITGFDSSYIDATFSIATSHINQWYPYDPIAVDLDGSFHAGECAGGSS